MRLLLSVLLSIATILASFGICTSEETAKTGVSDLESCLRALPADVSPTVISYHEDTGVLAIGDSHGVWLMQAGKTQPIGKLDPDDSAHLSDQQILYFNPKGNLLIAALGEDDLFSKFDGYRMTAAWHIPSGKPIAFAGLPHIVQTATFTPDGEDFLVAGENLSTGNAREERKIEKILLAFESQTGLMRLQKRRLKPWLIKPDPELDMWSDTFVAATNHLGCVAYATGNAIHIYRNRKLIYSIPVPDEGTVENVALSWTGDILAAAHDGQCSIWDLRPGSDINSPVVTLDFEAYYNKTFYLSPTGEYLLAYHYDSAKIHLLSRHQSTWKLEEDKDGHPVAVGFTPRGSMILLRAREGDDDVISYKIEYRPASDAWPRHATDWVEPTWKPTEKEWLEQERLANLPRIMVQQSIGKDLIAAPALSPDGNVLASVSEEGVFAWDVRTGRQIARLQKNFLSLDAQLWISETGRWLAIREDEGDITVYDILGQKTLSLSNSRFKKKKDIHPALPIMIELEGDKLSFRPIDSDIPGSPGSDELEIENIIRGKFTSDGTGVATLKVLDDETVTLECYRYPDLVPVTSGITVRGPDSINDMIPLNGGKRALVVHWNPDYTKSYNLYSGKGWLAGGEFPEDFVTNGAREVSPGTLIDGAGQRMIQVHGDRVRQVDVTDGISRSGLDGEVSIAPVEGGQVAVLRHRITGRETRWTEKDGAWTLVESSTRDLVFRSPGGQEFTVYEAKSESRMLSDAGYDPNIEEVFIRTADGKRYFSFQDMRNEHLETQQIHDFQLDILRQNGSGDWKASTRPVQCGADVTGTIGGLTWLRDRLWVFVDGRPAFIRMDDAGRQLRLERFPTTGSSHDFVSACVTAGDRFFVIGHDQWLIVWDLLKPGSQRHIRLPGSVSEIASHGESSILVGHYPDSDETTVPQTMMERGIIPLHSEVIQVNLVDSSMHEFSRKGINTTLSGEKRALIETNDKGFRIRDIIDGRLLAEIPWNELKKQRWPSFRAEISPDRRWLLVTTSNEMIVWDLEAGERLEWPQEYNEILPSEREDKLLTQHQGRFRQNSDLLLRSGLDSFVIELPSMYMKFPIPNIELETLPGLDLIATFSKGARIFHHGSGLIGMITQAEMENIGIYSRVFPIHRFNMLVFQSHNLLHFLSIASGRVVGTIHFAETKPDDPIPYWLLVSRSGHFQASDMDELRSVNWTLPATGSMKGLSPSLFMNTNYRPNLLAKLMRNQLDSFADYGSLHLGQPIVRTRLKKNKDPDLLDVLIDVKPPKDEKGTKAYNLKLFQNGRLIAGWPELIRSYDDMLQGESVFQEPREVAYGEHSITIPKPSGPADFYAYAYNQSGIKSEDSPVVTYEGETTKEASGRIVLLSVGVGKNAYADYTLDSTPRAALKMKQVIETATGWDVDTILMIDEAIGGVSGIARPTKANIAAALAALAGIPLPGNHSALNESVRKKLLDRIKPLNQEDILVISIHGHGRSSEGGFYIIPQDMPIVVSEMAFARADSAERRHAISDRELYAWLSSIHCRQIYMVIDTCNARAVVHTDESMSAPLVEHNLDRLSYDKSLPILLASGSTEDAQAADYNTNTVLVKSLQNQAEQVHTAHRDRPVEAIIDLFLASIRELEEKRKPEEQHFSILFHKRARIQKAANDGSTL